MYLVFIKYGIEFICWFEIFVVLFLILMGLVFFGWVYVNVGGFGEMLLMLF